MSTTEEGNSTTVVSSPAGPHSMASNASSSSGLHTNHSSSILAGNISVYSGISAGGDPASTASSLGYSGLRSIADSIGSKTVEPNRSNSFWLQSPKMDNLIEIFSLGCSTAVIFGGLIPYIPQYLKIKKAMSIEGFSTYVCLTLLIANILRIMFWFGHRFELPLLIQSFVMIFAMLAMVEISVRVRDTTNTNMISAIGFGSDQRRSRRFLIGFRSDDFWDWDDLWSYVKFLLLFTLIVSALTYLFINNHIYVETLGFIAVSTESMLGLPQLLRNYAKKSTRGMSVEMVVMWLSGDLFKTLYFITRHAPVQFYVCGSIQVIIDILIISQVLWYKRPNVTYRRLPKSN